MTSTPERKTRPANRRLRILDAAGQLFGTQGYESVGMGDIAEAVEVRPSALYRHFSSKEGLLDEILDRSVAELAAALADPDLSTQEGLLELAEYAVDNRHVSALIARDLPHLSDAARRQVRSRLRHISATMADRLSAAPARSDPDASLPPLGPHGADLLAQAVLAVLQSPAFYQFRLPRTELARDLALLIKRVAGADLPTDFGVVQLEGSGSGLMPASRREALLARAITLFAERTYAGVRVEDVAASLDIAGPSVYNHFSSKAEILATALERGSACLMMQAADALAGASGPAPALRTILSGYSHFAVAHPALMDLMITETTSLPEPAHQAVVTSALQYVGEMLHLLRLIHPDLSPAAARVQVQAALIIPSNIARVSRLRALEGVADAAAEVSFQSLALPASSGVG